MFYVPSGAAVWLMGMGLDGTRVLVSVSVSVLWMVLWMVGIGVGVVGRCGRGGVGAWCFFFGGGWCVELYDGRRGKEGGNVRVRVRVRGVKGIVGGRGEG